MLTLLTIPSHPLSTALAHTGAAETTLTSTLATTPAPFPMAVAPLLSVVSAATTRPRAATSPSTGLALIDRSASQHRPDARAAGGMSPHINPIRPATTLRRSGVLVPMSQRIHDRKAQSRCGATVAPWGIGTSTASERLLDCEGARHVLTPEPFVMFQTTRGGGNLRVEGYTLAVPLMTVAAFPTLRLIPTAKGLSPMSQVQGRTADLAEAAAAQKKRLIRIFSRDGVIDPEEMEVLQEQEAHTRALDEKADDEVYAAAVVKLGRRSGRVTRLNRELFPNGPEAA